MATEAEIRSQARSAMSSFLEERKKQMGYQYSQPVEAWQLEKALRERGIPLEGNAPRYAQEYLNEIKTPYAEPAGRPIAAALKSKEEEIAQRERTLGQEVKTIERQKAELKSKESAVRTAQISQQQIIQTKYGGVSTAYPQKYTGNIAQSYYNQQSAMREVGIAPQQTIPYGRQSTVSTPTKTAVAYSVQPRTPTDELGIAVATTMEIAKEAPPKSPLSSGVINEYIPIKQLETKTDIKNAMNNKNL